MKPSTRLLLVMLFSATLVAVVSSCAPKTGCPINEEAHVQPNKKGEYPRTRTRSSLFPKKMRKQLKH